MSAPKWLEIFIDRDAYTLSPEQLENLQVQSRKEMLWKYIVMNVLKPKTANSYFITSEGDFFMTSDEEYLQVRW